MVRLAARYGVEASFIDGASNLIGVWVDRDSPQSWRGDPRTADGAKRPEKIGAIGVRISRWITMHGFAFNVSTDLADFGRIVPCGIRGYGVTSLANLGHPAVRVEDAARASVESFSEVFGVEGVVAGPEQTMALMQEHSS
jgi:lipoyl(octanoyl) transferase